MGKIFYVKKIVKENFKVKKKLLSIMIKVGKY